MTLQEKTEALRLWALQLCPVWGAPYNFVAVLRELDDVSVERAADLINTLRDLTDSYADEPFKHAAMRCAWGALVAHCSMRLQASETKFDDVWASALMSAMTCLGDRSALGVQH